MVSNKPTGKTTLADRAGKVDLSLSRLGAGAKEPLPAVLAKDEESFLTPIVKPPKTSIGLHVGAIFQDKQLAADNAALTERLKEFDGANAERLLDPSKIHDSKWANRLQQSFSDPNFLNLQEEIRLTGTNVQAIKVRPSKEFPGEFEIVFGHRRRRACLNLGMPVRAVVEDMSDIELYTQMYKENIGQLSPRPYESGLSYVKAINDGLFPSARKLAESVGVDPSQLNKAIMLAGFPAEILAAFASPLDLQYQWANPINQVLQKTPELLFTRAKAIQELSPRPRAGEVFKRLIGLAPNLSREGSTDSFERKFVGAHGQQASIRADSQKRTMVVDLANIDPARFEEIQSGIRALLN